MVRTTLDYGRAYRYAVVIGYNLPEAVYPRARRSPASRASRTYPQGRRHLPACVSSPAHGGVRRDPAARHARGSTLAGPAGEPAHRDGPEAVAGIGANGCERQPPARRCPGVCPAAWALIRTGHGRGPTQPERSKRQSGRNPGLRPLSRRDSDFAFERFLALIAEHPRPAV